jgi:sugar phosphate isomerase/epimerase
MEDLFAFSSPNNTTCACDDVRGDVNEPIQSHARIGVVLGTSFPSISSRPSAVEEAATLVASDPYFTAVELGSIPDTSLRDRVLAICRSSHLSISFAGGPTIFSRNLSLNDRDPRARHEAIVAMKACIDEAQYLDSERFTVVSGLDCGPEYREKEIDLLVESLLELCAYTAASEGPPIDLETFDRDVERRRLVGPTSSAVGIARRVKSQYPSFGILLDISHVPLLDESLQGAIELAKEVLVHVHLGNCVKRDPSHPAFGDSHPPFGVPWGENGIPELALTLEALLKCGFLRRGRQEFVSFEVKPPAGESPLLVIAGSKRCLESAWWTMPG